MIEVDGSIHTKENIKIADEERQRLMESEGLRVLRLTNDEVTKYPETTIKKIQMMLHE